MDRLGLLGFVHEFSTTRLQGLPTVVRPFVILYIVAAFRPNSEPRPFYVDADFQKMGMMVIIRPVAKNTIILITTPAARTHLRVCDPPS